MKSYGELRDAGTAILRDAVGSAADDPRWEATRLLEVVTGLSRGELVRRRDQVVEIEAIADYLRLLEERRRGVPLQLLAGHVDFHEITVRVEPGVFIPRPETELLVELARADVASRLASESDREIRILDLCTGTGAIALALAAAFRAEPRVRVAAGEWSPQAVRIARRNAEDLGLAVDVRRSDLFSAFADLEGAIDVLVSNPPYIAPGETLPVEVQHDPPAALYDPEGGTGFHRRIARRGRDFLRPGGMIVLEIGETQDEETARILNEEQYREVGRERDLTGRPRFVRGIAREGGVVPSMRSS
ncbi:MAG: peptide chain release factor N(5)-glutamine methyltransferase [Gemmatimonadetes bacterium]|nr:peptide chain release factor N(5)-glutamine methyltransferase [Gemmatimonadota bacterium]